MLKTPVQLYQYCSFTVYIYVCSPISAVPLSMNIEYRPNLVFLSVSVSLKRILLLLFFQLLFANFMFQDVYL